LVEPYLFMLFYEKQHIWLQQNKLSLPENNLVTQPEPQNLLLLLLLLSLLLLFCLFMDGLKLCFRFWTVLGFG
jgi:hypothetical protein